MCNHEKSKITKRHFNKSGRLVATKVHCLKCGSFETTTTTTTTTTTEPKDEK